MPNVTQSSVASLWRYPVKSMLGEELTTTEVTERGLLGDRAYALVDSADGKAATAKNPKKWPTLFGFRATFIEPPRPGASAPTVRITLPDGTTATSQQADLNQVLSKALNRTVTLNAAGRGHAGTVNAEEYWPDIEGLDFRDTVTDFGLPEGTFFDGARKGTPGTRIGNSSLNKIEVFPVSEIGFLRPGAGERMGLNPQRPLE